MRPCKSAASRPPKRPDPLGDTPTRSRPDIAKLRKIKAKKVAPPLRIYPKIIWGAGFRGPSASSIYPTHTHLSTPKTHFSQKNTLFPQIPPPKKHPHNHHRSAHHPTNTPAKHPLHPLTHSNPPHAHHFLSLPSQNSASPNKPPHHQHCAPAPGNHPPHPVTTHRTAPHPCPPCSPWTFQAQKYPGQEPTDR